MCYDEYDDDYIDYDDLDDGEQYSYSNYEKEMERKRKQREYEIDKMMTSEIFYEIYTDILVAHGFDREEIEGISEEDLHDLIVENDLMEEVTYHKKYGETW